MRPPTFGSGISWTRSRGALPGALGSSCDTAYDPTIITVIHNAANIFMFPSKCVHLKGIDSQIAHIHDTAPLTYPHPISAETGVSKFSTLVSILSHNNPVLM